jgi:hypothetical protein
MNNFGILFEYSNNIRIFILLNKLLILAKISKKNHNCVEITENLVLGLICTQMCQQITKLDFLDFFGEIWPTLHCTATFEHSTDMATLDTYKFYNRG